MTFECILRAVPEGAAERSGAVERWGDGGVEGRKVVAAAKVRPKLERKVEENRMEVKRDILWFL